MKKTILLLVAFAAILTSCDKDNSDGPSGIWKDSVFITNEGPFQGGTGTVIAYNRQSGETSEDLFEAANGRPLGNIVQSITVAGEVALIAVNNSNKVEIVSMEDFKSVATIENITLPRYVVAHNDKAYISCWDNTIRVASLADYSILDQLPAGTGPDEMEIAGEFLFAVNAGGYGIDSTVSFVNMNDKEIYGLIEVGHKPMDIEKDKNGKLWVLCYGRGYNGFPDPSDTHGKLVFIDPATRTVISEFVFPDASLHPDHLVVSEDGKTLYYAYPDGIYRFSVDNPAIESQPFIPSDVMFYSLGFDPVSDMIYASDPLDYSQNGRIYRFKAADGTPVASFEGGIIPGSFWFNQ